MARTKSERKARIGYTRKRSKKQIIQTKRLKNKANFSSSNVSKDVGNCEFGDSTVARTVEMKRTLLEMLQDDAPGACWRKCYRASESGYSASTFHSYCDKKGPTVTLLRVGKYVSGGYVENSWNGDAGNINGGKAFLFSLNSNLKFPWKTDKVTFSNPSYGPTFGHGHDLYISNKCNENTYSYYNIGSSYQLPDGYTAKDARMKLIGQTEQHFKCSEYEVYYQIS